jgi:hypothetical protein
MRLVRNSQILSHANHQQFQQSCLFLSLCIRQHKQVNHETPTPSAVYYCYKCFLLLKSNMLSEHKMSHAREPYLVNMPRTTNYLYMNNAFKVRPMPKCTFKHPMTTSKTDFYATQYISNPLFPSAPLRPHLTWGR